MGNDKSAWMVRAGEGGHLIDDFRDKNLVAIGWDVGDLSHLSTPEEIRVRVKKTYSDYKPGQQSNFAGQLSRFIFDFHIGDYVVTYNPEERIYLIGEIVGDYEYNTKLIEDYPNVRRVKWLGKVSRDKLSTPSKNTLGAIQTVFNLGENVKVEILKLLKGEEEVKEEIEAEEEELDSLREDIIAKANEFIKDMIYDLDWEEMQELVAGLLRGNGIQN